MLTAGNEAVFHVRRRAPRLLLCSSALVVFFRATAALAQSTPLAEKLFEQGRESEEAGAPAEACALFEASAKLEAEPASRLKVAACMEREGKVTAALAELRALLEISRNVAGPRGKEIQEDIGQRIVAVEKKVAKLRVTAPESTSLLVSLDGAVVQNGALRDWRLLDPGTHRLEAVTAGGPAITRSFQLREGEEKTIDLGSLVSPAPPGSAPLVKPGLAVTGPRMLGPAHASRPSTPWQWVAGAGLTGLGVASLGGALALGIHTLKTVDDARDTAAGPLDSRHEGEQLRQNAVASQDGALACLGVGLALASAGVTVLVLSPSSPKDSAPVVRATVHPQGASFQMLW